MERTYIVSKTYQVVTEESIENGDFYRQGFVFKDIEMTVEEIVRQIENDGFSEWSSSVPTIYDWLSTIDADINYVTGEHTFYGLHIKNMDENLLTELENSVG